MLFVICVVRYSIVPDCVVMDSIENVHDHYAFYSQNMICIIPESISQKFSLVTVKNRRKQEVNTKKNRGHC